MKTTKAMIAMVHQLQAKIRHEGGIPVRIEIWDDAVTYANSLLGQLEELES